MGWTTAAAPTRSGSSGSSSEGFRSSTPMFPRLYPDRQQYTFWDYRKPSSLDANKGWRIDHILATPSLAEHCTKCDVDVEPRRDPNPSDHTFLWAEFAM